MAIDLKREKEKERKGLIGNANETSGVTLSNVKRIEASVKRNGEKGGGERKKRISRENKWQTRRR